MERCSYCGNKIRENDFRHWAYLDNLPEETIICDTCLTDSKDFRACDTCGAFYHNSADTVIVVNDGIEAHVCPWCAEHYDD